MAIVVDASAALAAILPDERSPHARAAMAVAATSGLIVPALWIYEVQNGLRAAVRRERITPEDATRALRALDAIPVDVRVPPRLGREFALARTHDLTAYDASYLAVALDAIAPLASFDVALERAARAAGVAIFEPPSIR